MRQRETEGFRGLFASEGCELDSHDIWPYSRFVMDLEWSEDTTVERRELQAIQSRLQRN